MNTKINPLISKMFIFVSMCAALLLGATQVRAALSQVTTLSEIRHEADRPLALAITPSATRTIGPTRTPSPTRTSSPTATSTQTQTASPTLTPTPTGLFAVVDPALNLADFPPGAGFTLHFSSPINPESVQQPIYTFPWVEGEFSWNSTHTALTFRALDGFEDNTLYHFYLNNQVAAQDGTPLIAAQDWVVQTGDKPKVVSRLPVQVELYNPQTSIVLFFNREMDYASVAEALSVQPEIEYELTVDGSRFEITPVEPLEAGISYQFKLEKTAQDSFGSPLEDEYTWQYFLAPVTMEIYIGLRLNYLSSPLMLELNYPVDAESFEQAIIISPTLAYSLSWAAPNIVRIEPTSPWELTKLYTVTCIGEIQHTLGYTLTAAASITFTTPVPIKEVKPSDQAQSLNIDNAFFRITFLHPMDRKSVEEAFKITPATAGEISWNSDNTVFRYYPSSSLLEFTDYTAELAPSARDAEGKPILLTKYAWTFTTGWNFSSNNIDNAPVTFGIYGPNVQVIDVDGRRAIQYSSSRTNDPITFELYRLEIQTFVEAYAADSYDSGWPEPLHRIPIEGYELSYSWQISNPDGGISELFIPSAVPPGLYILNAKLGEISSAELFVSLTRNQLVVKRSGDQVIVWATDINGAALPGVEIRIYNYTGVKLREGYANEDGVYRTTLYGEYAPLLAFAHAPDEDFTISGFDDTWGYNSGIAALPDYRAYTFTDRPIYRPGQTVNFKALLRQDDDALYTLPPENTPVTINIRDSRNNIVQSYILNTNEFGAVNASFTLAEGAMLGEYNIETIIGSENRLQPFKVQVYRKPEIQLSLRTQSETYVIGETISLTVNAKYFFGKPVSDGRLILRLAKLTPAWCLYCDEDFEEDYVWEVFDILDEPVFTDSSGFYTYTIDTTEIYWGSTFSSWDSNLRSATIGLEVSAKDSSSQSVTGFSIIKIYNAAERITLDRGDWLKSPGQTFTLRANVENVRGEAVSGRTLAYSIVPLNQKTWEFDTAPLISATLTTDANGNASVPVTVSGAGYHRIVVKGIDPFGNPIQTTRYFYAFDDAQAWMRSSRDELRITLDKESYRPYETARLMIESVVSGPALLTLERGKVHRAMLVELTAPITFLEVPVLPQDSPNIFITLSIWQPQDTRPPEPPTEEKEEWYYYYQPSRADSRLLRTKIQILVPPSQKMLAVDIEPDADMYTPGSTAVITVSVSDWQGNPVSAEVSLALVDEAIFSLSEELSKPIFDGFYETRKNNVSTYNSMAPTRILAESGGGGGRGGGGGQYSTEPRSEFSDTAAWLPALQTGKDGVVTATITLPDNLTSWRITAKAITAETQVGEAIANVLTQKAVVIRPQLPNALTQGDVIELTALVHNYTAEPLDLNVTLALDSAVFGWQSSPTQTITLEANEVGVVGWVVTAQQAGEVQMTMRAVPVVSGRAAGQQETLGDAVRLPLSVLPLAVPEVTSQAGAFTQTVSLPFYLPTNALEMSTIEIQLNRTLASSLLEGLDYLTGYPYGCVEQTMSRALPNAVVGRAYELLGVEDLGRKEALKPLVAASIQKLYGFQHEDGGWGWWFDDNTDDYQTAWVVFGLENTRQAGYEIDPAVIGRGADYLASRLDGMDTRTRAYALYSMAVSGHGDLAATRQAVETIGALDPFSQAALALALEKLGAHADALSALQILQQSATQNTGMVYWLQPYGDGHYHAKTMSSTTRSTALALEAFVLIDPQNELIPGAVAWLMSQRRANGWGSTNETSYAILALSDYLLAEQEASPETGYTIELNGSIAASGTMSSWGEAVSVQIPAGKLQSGLNQLQLSHSGDGRMYYAVVQRFYLAEEEIQAAGSVTVTRTYLDDETGKPIAEFTPGQLIRIRLTVTSPRQGNFFIIEDHLPSGLEAINENLNTSSHESTSVEYGYYYDDFRWERLGYNYKEIRGERVTFFITNMGTEVKIIEYRARVTHIGSFAALPAEAYAMYDSALWGRSSSQRIQVKAE